MNVIQTVWKFEVPFPGTDVFEIEIPKGAKILTVQLQDGSPKIWVLVDTFNVDVSRKFKVVGTGYKIRDKIIEYIGTFQIVEYGLVYHLFEVE
jgi:hypothetical protein